MGHRPSNCMCASICVCVRACSYVKQGEICTNGVTQTKNEGLTEDPHT